MLFPDCETVYCATGVTLNVESGAGCRLMAAQGQLNEKDYNKARRCYSSFPNVRL